MSEVEQWASRQGLFPDHCFFKTSGSSGREKWVALSREALEWSARTVNEALGVDHSDVLGLALPEVHVGGYGLIVRAEISGARLARFEEKWDACSFAAWCREEGVTISSLVPTQVHDLVGAGSAGPSSLRVVVVGGGSLDQDLREQARRLGWPVVPSYGMTETASQVATGDGLPLLPGWEAKVVDGRLVLRGGGLFTALIFRSDDGFVAEDPKVEGWFLTNDRVEIAEGCLRVLGRADRLVKVLGELVDLEQVESFWRDRLGVEVAVVTRADERRGVSLHLFFEGEGKGLAEWNQQSPGLHRLAGWQNLERLPRSALGKVDRAALASHLQKIHQD